MIMTENGWRPLWTVGPVAFEPVAWMPLSGKWDAQEHASMMADRKAFEAEQQAKINDMHDMVPRGNHAR